MIGKKKTGRNPVSSNPPVVRRTNCALTSSASVAVAAVVTCSRPISTLIIVVVYEMVLTAIASAVSVSSQLTLPFPLPLPKGLFGFSLISQEMALPGLLAAKTSAVVMPQPVTVLIPQPFMVQLALEPGHTSIVQRVAA